ncbi:MAG: Lrp/AsnC ligand binding domain-containing protein [Candidatus Geothermarchaeales archaeon]
MVVAFVMINVAPGEEETVRERVHQVEGVEEVHVVYGIYDMVVKVTAGAIRDIKDIVTRRIRTLPEVRSTLTMIVVEE